MEHDDSKENMKSTAIDLTVLLAKSKLSHGGAQFVTAQLLAILFREQGISQHTAVDRFVTVLKNVYAEKGATNG